MKYYNRKKELDSLQSLGKKHFVVLWGRRRIGKTSLALQRFPKNLYFFVSRKSSELLLEEFTELVRRKWKYVPTFKNWEEFFTYLFTEYNGTIMMDEFQNFRFVDKSVFSILQKVIDSSEDYQIIVIGSYVGIMKHIFMDAKEPLYGRTTGIMKIHPLKFSTIFRILDDMKIKNFQEKVDIYSIFGGIPYYYTLMENYEIKNFDDILKKLVFSGLAPLKYEVRNILLEEFGRNYSSYFSVLQSIAIGKSTLTDIANKSGVEVKSISKYLKELTEVYDLIERVIPINGGKRGIYRIKDPFTKFWFRYVERYLSEIEIGSCIAPMEKVLEEKSIISSWEFENIVGEILANSYGIVGKWWNRIGDEIDVIGVNKKNKTVIFGEVKWTNKKIGEKESENLRNKANMVKGFRNYTKKYLLVSKIGFKKGNYGGNVILWNIKDLKKIIGEIDN